MTIAAEKTPEWVPLEEAEALSALGRAGILERVNSGQIPVRMDPDAGTLVDLHYIPRVQQLAMMPPSNHEVAARPKDVADPAPTSPNRLGPMLPAGKLQREVRTWLEAHPGVTYTALSLAAGQYEGYVSKLLSSEYCRAVPAACIRHAMAHWDGTGTPPEIPEEIRQGKPATSHRRKRTPKPRCTEEAPTQPARRPWWAFWRRSA